MGQGRRKKEKTVFLIKIQLFVLHRRLGFAIIKETAARVQRRMQFEKERGIVMYKEMMDTIGLVNGVDPEVGAAMGRELTRQRENIELIASENIVSPAVMAAMGSVLTNKYAEGLPGKRYYGGCVYVDEVENIAIRRACQLFG